MAQDSSSFGNDHFPEGMAQEIVFEWTQTAYDEHQQVTHAVSKHPRTSLTKEESLAPSSFVTVLPDSREDVCILDVTTYVLPDPLCQELLESPTKYYIDFVAAMVCANLISLESMRSAPESPIGLLSPSFGLDAMSDQFAYVRRVFLAAKAQAQTIFLSSRNIARLELVQIPAQVPKYNLALKSAVTLLTFDNDIEVSTAVQSVAI